MLIEVNFLDYIDFLKFKSEDGKKYVWDDIRKKWYVLQPEEMVRQLVVEHLYRTVGYNKNRIQLEKFLKVNTLERRCDILIYDDDIQPYFLIECKRPEIEINQKVFDQVALYNIELQVDFLMVTNGIQTYCCKIHQEEKTYQFLDYIPK